ncbi:MAG: hypothetical protein LBR10_07005 [Prevotellaceae bacterium]|nr:hypothetical protein [Prevotellaceae bacterium]
MTKRVNTDGIDESFVIASVRKKRTIIPETEKQEEIAFMFAPEITDAVIPSEMLDEIFGEEPDGVLFPINHFLHVFNRIDVILFNR